MEFVLFCVLFFLAVTVLIVSLLFRVFHKVFQDKDFIRHVCMFIESDIFTDILYT